MKKTRPLWPVMMDDSAPKHERRELVTWRFTFCVQKYIFLHISSRILYFLGLGLLLRGLGLVLGFGVGLGVGLNTYKTIFMNMSSASVSQRIAHWTFNPMVPCTIPALHDFFFYIIEEHPQIILTLKISELKWQVSLPFSGKSMWYPCDKWWHHVLRCRLMYKRGGSGKRTKKQIKLQTNFECLPSSQLGLRFQTPCRPPRRLLPDLHVGPPPSMPSQTPLVLSLSPFPLPSRRWQIEHILAILLPLCTHKVIQLSQIYMWVSFQSFTDENIKRTNKIYDNQSWDWY